MPLITNDHVIRKEWADSINWDIQFVDKPIPNFPDWLPVSSVSRPLWSLSTTAVKHPFFAIPVLQGNNTKSPQIDINVYEDDAGDVYNYFADWVNKDIINQGEGLSFIKQYARMLLIRKVNRLGKTIGEWSDYVAPIGSYSMEGTSKSGTIQKSFSLAILSNYIRK